MNPDPSGWQSYEPGVDSLPPALGEGGVAGGEIVVLAVFGGAPEEGRSWAREAAAGLARSWASSTERLFLMDLDLEEPELHRILGAENGEGATDVFLYGSSIQRIARPVDDGAFFFAPAGTPTAEPEAVFRHDRWRALIRGFRDADARLLLHLPLSLPGSDAVLERADRIVVLGARGDVDSGRLADFEAAVSVVLVPPEPETEEQGEVESATVLPEETVVDIAELAPDPVAEPEREAEPSEAEIVDIADLAPDEVAEEPEPVSGDGGRTVVDIAALAPDSEPTPATDAHVPADQRVEVGGAGWEPEEAGGEEAHELESSDLPDPGGDPGDGEDESEIDREAEEEAVHAEDPGREDAEAEAAEAEIEGVEAAGAEHDEAEIEDADLDEPEADEAIGGFGWSADAEDEGTHGLSGTEEDGESFADFDLGSFDQLSEDAEEEAEEGDVEFTAGFGGWEEGADEGSDVEGGPEPVAEEPEETGEGGEEVEFAGMSGEPEETGLDGKDDEAEAGDFGDLSGGMEETGFEEDGPEESADADEGGFDFGDFGGELEEEGDVEPTEALGGEEDMSAGPSFDDAPGGGSDAAGAPADEFGDDLVTGPDFGGGAPNEEPDWESEEPTAEESPEEDLGAAAGAGTVPGGSDEGEDDGEDREAEDADGEGAAEVEAEGAAPRRSSGRAGRLALFLLLVLVGAAAGHWFGVVQVPGLDRVFASFLGPAGTGPAPTVETVEPEPGTPVMGYSLGVDAYRDLQAASEVAAALRSRLPGRLFVVTPVQVDGDVFHRLLAGPARNVQEAESLREPLSGVLTRENPDDWVVRATPLAFLVDETTSLESARARVSTLGQQGISAYVLQVEYGGDTLRYRVYAGAYETPDEARAMQGLLIQAGVSDAAFTERRGRIPE